VERAGLPIARGRVSRPFVGARDLHPCYEMIYPAGTTRGATVSLSVPPGSSTLKTGSSELRGLCVGGGAALLLGPRPFSDPPG